jgi:uncharacterized protein YqeY
MSNNPKTLKEQIRADMISAMKSGKKGEVGVIRLITAAVKQREVDERIELDDEQVILVMDKMVKQRRESISQYTAANRIDLADVEAAEIEIIKKYLPQPLSDTEIDAMIAEAISTVSAVSIRDMGKVMGLVKPKMQGRVDMSVVSGRIKGLLG